MATVTLNCGEWFDTKAWGAGAVPGPGDDVIIAEGNSILYDAAKASSTIRSLTVAGALWIDAGVFSITGALTVDAGGTLGIENAVLTVTGTITNAGLFEKTGGAGVIPITASFKDKGSVAVAAGTLSFSGRTNTFAGAITGEGTVSFAGGATTLETGTTASVAHLSTLGSGAKLIIAERLSYDGSFSEGAGTTLSIGGEDELSLSGTASMAGTTSGAGTFVLADGIATIGCDAKLSVANWSISGAGADVTLGENLSYAGSFSECARATLVLSGGDLLLSGADTFSGGTVDGSMALETEGTTNVSGLAIGGTVEWENTQTVQQTGGTVTIGDACGDKAFLVNASTGTYDIIGNGGIDRGSCTASYIDNAGLFEKTEGTGVSTISTVVTNAGTIAVSTATLDFEAAIFGTGADQIWGDSTLEFDAAVSSGQTASFFGCGGELVLRDPAAFSGSISGFDTFGSYDTIEVAGPWVYAGFTENTAGTGGTLAFANGSSHIGFTLAGDYDPANFVHQSGPGGSTLITYR